MAQTYEFQAGETIRIPLLLTDGNKDLVQNVRANLKLTVGAKQTPPLSTPPSAVCEVVPTNLGWMLEVPADVSAALKPGLYVVNAAMEVTGTTIISDPSYVKLLATTTI